MSGPRRGVDGLMDALESWDVERVFVCPGSTEAAFLSAARERGRPQLTLVTHESVAAAAADGYARLSGRPGVAYVHANVGLANAIVHLPGAELACSPVVILNGLKSTGVQSRRGFTTSPQMPDYVRQHAKLAWQCLSPDHVADDVRRALRVASAEPRGPVWIGLPQDVLEAEAQAAPHPRRTLVFDRVPASPAAIEALHSHLAEARQPLLIAGPEVAERSAADLLTELARRLDAPVVMEDRRSLEWSTYPTDDPHFAGYYDARDGRLAEADVVVALGVRRVMDFEHGAGPLPRTRALIQTCAAPAFLGEPPGVDVAIAGDVELILRALRDGLLEPPPELAAARASWRESLLARSAGPSDGPGSEAPTGAMSVRELIEALGTALPDDTLVVSDTTTSHGAVLRYLPRPLPGSLIATSSGALGWGLGAAVGAAIAAPNRRVVALVGDGVTQFGVQALWTAAREGLPVTFVVIDNSSYAAVGAAQRRHGDLSTPIDELPGKDLSGTRLDVVAEGLGVPSIRVEAAERVGAALREALRRPGPTLIDAVTDPNDLGPSARPETA
jgi:thiamine pyrophosphate-dependent acetolactate synthase large subunit-like protein